MITRKSTLIGAGLFFISTITIFNVIAMEEYQLGGFNQPKPMSAADLNKLTLNDLQDLANKLISKAFGYIKHVDIKYKFSNPLIDEKDMIKAEGKLPKIADVSEIALFVYPKAVVVFNNAVENAVEKNSKSTAVQELKKSFLSPELRRYNENKVITTLLQTPLQFLNQNYQLILQAIKNLNGSVSGLPEKLSLESLRNFATQK